MRRIWTTCGSGRSFSAWSAEDPKFAAGHSIERVWRRRTVVAGAVVLVGVMLLVVGLVTTQASVVAGLVISIVGFLSMVGGAAMFIGGPAAVRSAVELSACRPGRGEF